MSSFSDLTSLVGVDEEKTLFDDFNSACTLSYKTRMYCFAICFCLGWFFAFLGCFYIVDIAQNPEPFAICYTLGSLISIFSTGFLLGPVKQLKLMFKPVRIVATIVYIFSIALTLFLAFYVQKALPVILSLILQLAAAIWYCASYIPYGRKLITNCLGGLVSS